jgi:hypothetical protein
MKIQEAIAMQQAIRNVTSMGYKFKPRAAYAIALNSKRLEPELSAFEEARKTLLDEFATKDDKGEFVQIKDEFSGQMVYDVPNKDLYNAKYQDLMDQDIDARVKQLDKPEDFGQADIEPMIMLALLPMIAEE